MDTKSVATSDRLVNPTRDEVLEGVRLANRIIWACDSRNRRSAYAGRTWGDFKRAVEQVGVTDTTDLASIDFGSAQHGTGYVLVDDNEFGAACIKEIK